MQQIGKGFYMTEESLERAQIIRYGPKLRLFRMLKSLFKGKAKETSEPTN